MKNNLKLPTKTGWCAVWFDEKGKQHIIHDSYSKTKKRALRIADEYMFINQVKTDIVECMY